jgi:pheromone a factor receptor
MSSHPALTPAHYLRLSALALSDLILSTALAAFTIYLNTVASPISPWISWADTHFDYGRIEQVPHVLSKSRTTTTTNPATSDDLSVGMG